MTRKDLNALKLGSARVGEMVALGTLNCRFIEYTSYVWRQRSPVPAGSRNGYTPHPRREGFSVLLLFDRTLAYEVGGIPVRLTMTSYYACGPCGFWAQVEGSIGETQINARGILTGTLVKRDFIEPITVDNFIFHIEYGISNFSLAVLEVKPDS